MPGFTTHYLFGLNTYKQLQTVNLKNAIRRQHTVYSLGLQGPDIFFYYLPSYVIHDNHIGSIAHISRTGKFLEQLLNSFGRFSHTDDREIAIAYIAGFLGHYILDTRCHPYIYWRSDFHGTKNACLGRHMALESDIDTELLWFYQHRKPSQFPPASSVMLTLQQKHIIAAVLHYAYRKTYPDISVTYRSVHTAITAMQHGLTLLYDPSGRKRQILRRLECMLLGYPFLSSMILRDCPSLYSDPLNMLHRQWRNPWEHTFVSHHSFLELIELAQWEYADILTSLSDICFRQDQKSNDKISALLRQLGNNSYHSGLPIDA